ncbi:MAG: aminotransferase class I/II-fold pyridoxal phosphate-dependent enzyme, partial [Bryobacteraceae bacterium]|nr:aminotransferase class I/II-fold pyridoxal phosphate-dependent enzyme [Bryobacteraceae bacterium]
MELISREVRENLLARGFTRRMFGRVTTMVTAAASMPFYSEYALAQLSGTAVLPPGAVKINSNESPYGPSKEALQAVQKAAADGHRYQHNLAIEFSQLVAQQEGVRPDYVQAYAGSSDPLHRASLGFTSPTKSLVMGSPGYEPGAMASKFIGSKVHMVALTGSHAHDVKAMASADPNAGLIYLCNPNNPTGSITSAEDIDWLVANKPKGSVVLLDECYIQFSDQPKRSDLVQQDKDVIVLRSLSKLYGMAGLRAGYALGRPDLLAKLKPWGIGMIPATGMAAGIASLKSATLEKDRKAMNKRVRNDTF